MDAVLPFSHTIASFHVLKVKDAARGFSHGAPQPFMKRGQTSLFDQTRPRSRELYVARPWSYAHDMKTQFVLWLGLIFVGLAYMTLISFSGR